MILRTVKLSKDYVKFRALDALDLEVKKGEIVGILGPNGSGKSTALRILLGFLRPTSGEASIAGYDCWSDGVNARRQVAYLPGELRQYENMTGRQLVRFLGELRGQLDYSELPRYSQAFDIDIDRPLSQLSSGMKRKIALMTVLLPKTPLMILDEPTNTLDPSMRDALLTQLAKARELGQTVLFSSHVLGEVEQVCDRVAVLKLGKLVHLQNMNELREVRRIRVHFAGAMVSPPAFASLRRWRSEGGDLVLEWVGPLQELLSWLGTQSVLDLKIEPLGLSDIYQRYHAAA